MVFWLLPVARPIIIVGERIWSRWYCPKDQFTGPQESVVMIIFRQQSQLTGARLQRVSWALQNDPRGMTSSGSLWLAEVNFQCRTALSDPTWAVSSPLNPLSDCQMLNHSLALILPVLPEMEANFQQKLPWGHKEIRERIDPESSHLAKNPPVRHCSQILFPVLSFNTISLFPSLEIPAPCFIPGHVPSVEACDT